MNGATLRIGTRGSALALWQANHVAKLIAALPGAPPTAIVVVRTTGDAVTDIPLWQVPGKAFFTKELDDALLQSQIDLAVHSLKDLATELPDGLVLGAVPEREDPRDALICAASANALGSTGAVVPVASTVRAGAAPPGVTLATLGAGARVGTSSVRRRAFLRHHRPDLTPAELRGNVPTRIAHLDEGRYDAIIVAAAGVNRLGLANRISGFLDPEAFPPAAAQGALGICARANDSALLALLARLDDHAARLTTSSERAFLSRLGAGCQVPAGVLAQLATQRVAMHGVMCATDGRNWASARREVSAGDALPAACDLADELRTRAGVVS
jgi:hydroxymethylbilane synthase